MRLDGSGHHGSQTDASSEDAGDAAFETGVTDTNSDSNAANVLPNGRANFVMALMLARYNASVVRLSTWQLNTSGAIEEKYWLWDQTKTPVPANIDAWRADTAYRTEGCAFTCEVWTSRGFEPGALASVRTGTFSRDDETHVTVRWSEQVFERYRIINHATYTELRLVSHGYQNVSAVYAKAFGSHASLASTASIDALRENGNLEFTVYEQVWNNVTNIPDHIKDPKIPPPQIDIPSYERCADSPIMVGRYNKPTNPYDTSGYHTYFVADAARGEGRKMYWYHQLEAVSQQNDGCANPERGGHLTPLLQILDDDENFVGFVGVEASLYGTHTGGSVISWIEARPDIDAPGT